MRWKLASALLLSVGSALGGQDRSVDVSAINAGIISLRSMPSETRNTAVRSFARQISALPDSRIRTALALSLTSRATEGETGRDGLQPVADMLAQVILAHDAQELTDLEQAAVVNLASLSRYEGVTVASTIALMPSYREQVSLLIANDNDAASSNVIVRELSGARVRLRPGMRTHKVVVVNFWATWCQPCVMELDALNAVARRYSRRVRVIALTQEDGQTVRSFFRGRKPSFQVLIDEHHEAFRRFHVDAIPRTYIFDTRGKLAAEAIDARTETQFNAMLHKSGM